MKEFYIRLPRKNHTNLPDLAADGEYHRDYIDFIDRHEARPKPEKKPFKLWRDMKCKAIL